MLDRYHVTKSADFLIWKDQDVHILSYFVVINSNKNKKWSWTVLRATSEQYGLKCTKREGGVETEDPKRQMSQR